MELTAAQEALEQLKKPSAEKGASLTFLGARSAHQTFSRDPLQINWLGTDSEAAILQDHGLTQVFCRSRLLEERVELGSWSERTGESGWPRASWLHRSIY